MIDEEATFARYKYYSYELPPRSHKPILAACDGCGKVRETPKYNYRGVCNSCARKCNTNSLGCKHTEEQNARQHEAHKGEKHWNYGKTTSEETKALISTNHADVSGVKNPMFGKTGKNSPNFGSQRTEETKAKQSVAMTGKKNPNYKGGKELAEKHHSAKRRQLGFIGLNSYFEGCEGHHITHDFIIYIPKWLHRSTYHNLNTGQGMKVINALALDFLLNGF